MNDRIPRSQGDHVLVDVKAKPSGGLRPALTPTPGAVRWQRAGRRPKGDPQIQVSTVSGDCRGSDQGWVTGHGCRATMAWPVLGPAASSRFAGDARPSSHLRLVAQECRTGHPPGFGAGHVVRQSRQLLEQVGHCEVGLLGQV
jgi:hypothetical protein